MLTIYINNSTSPIQENSLTLGFLKQGMQISGRKLVAVTIINSGTLSWFFLVWLYFIDIFQNIGDAPSTIYVVEAAFLGFGALSALVGSEICKTIKRRILLSSWILLGVLATALLLVSQGEALSILLGMLLGISLGLGFPSCTAFLSDATRTWERARVSGLVILETFFMVFFSIIVISFFRIGLLGIILLSVVLRSTSFLALILDPVERKEEKETQWRDILENSDFVYYFSPWLLFNIASGLISLIWLSPEYVPILVIANPLHYGGTAIGGLFAGTAADRFGRKQPIMFGLILLGVSFALLGLAASYWTLVFYMAASGFAWGFLMVIYLAVPGDLALSRSKEKHYALSAIIPLVIYMSIPGAVYAMGLSAPVGSLSSTLSIIVFLSIIPVLRAKETLRESKIEERKLKEHVEKVGELVSQSEDISKNE